MITDHSLPRDRHVYAGERNRQFSVAIVPASRLGSIKSISDRAKNLPGRTPVVGVPDSNPRLLGVAHRIEWKSRHGRESLMVLITRIH
jgi:hypothetical protein